MSWSSVSAPAAPAPMGASPSSVALFTAAPPRDERCSRCCCVDALKATVGKSRRRYASHCRTTSGGTRSILFSTRTTRLGGSSESASASTAGARHASGSRASRTTRRMSAFSMSTLMCL